MRFAYLVSNGRFWTMRFPVSFLASLLLVASACNGGSTNSLAKDALVIVVSSDLAIGRNRVAVGALTDANESLVTDIPVSFEFFRPDGTPAGAAPARFIWAIPDVRGLWVSEFTFDDHGGWTVGIRTEDGQLVRSAPFSVSSQATTIAVGDAAPSSYSKTLVDGSLSEITSDVDPDESLYQKTVSEAVNSGNPSVIIFSTPAFCTSATCGPVLDVAKHVKDSYTHIEWVHVEVFDNLHAATREELVPVAAVGEWRLATEPWVFVVGADGIVATRFEGAMDEAELRTALDGLAG